MAGKHYTAIIYRRADRMLTSHTEFLARVSTTNARKLIADFHAAIKTITGNPLLYPFADDTDADNIPPNKYRKCLFHDRYKALYWIEGNHVYIDAIIDCRQDNSDLF
jgi:plasmid stabilization system protein ParE